MIIIVKSFQSEYSPIAYFKNGAILNIRRMVQQAIQDFKFHHLEKPLRHMSNRYVQEPASEWSKSAQQTKQSQWLWRTRTNLISRKDSLSLQCGFFLIESYKVDCTC